MNDLAIAVALVLGAIVLALIGSWEGTPARTRKPTDQEILDQREREKRRKAMERVNAAYENDSRHWWI